MTERGRPSSYYSQRSSYYSSSGSRYTYEKPLAERIKDCCRFTIAFTFSNVGICGLMVGYTIMGSYLFQFLEGGEPPASQITRFEMEKYRESVVKRLWNITLDYNTFHRINWTASTTEIVESYGKHILKEIGKGYQGKDIEYGSHLQWGEETGFLYSLTVITTIGYGHITPVKLEGRIATIFYAIFGMPVFLLYMANMGDILAKSLKWLYAKIMMCKKSTPQYDTHSALKSADALLRGSLAPGFMIPQNFPRDRRGAIYDLEEYEDEDYRYDRREIPSVSRSVDRGFRMGHLEPEHRKHINQGHRSLPPQRYEERYPGERRGNEYGHSSQDYERGKGSFHSRSEPRYDYDSRRDQEYDNRRSYEYNERRSTRYNQRRQERYDDDDYQAEAIALEPIHRSYDRSRGIDGYNYSNRYQRDPHRHSARSREYHPDGFYPSYSSYGSDAISNGSQISKSEKLDLSTVNIPIAISLSIMISLLTGGMFLFRSYEKNWDYVTSFYFCFISLTTIGFGDYVPGNALEEEGTEGFIYCAVYLMIGLALLSMCFNLMQEEVVQAVTRCLRAVRMTDEKKEQDS